MPSRTALRLCPSAIFLPARFEVYRAVSQQIMAIFHQHTSLVEPLSLDEAYLDVTTTVRDLDEAVQLAREIKRQIREKTELTASAGVSERSCAAPRIIHNPFYTSQKERQRETKIIQEPE